MSSAVFTKMTSCKTLFPILFIFHTAVEDTITLCTQCLKIFDPHLQRLQVIQPNTTTLPLGSTGSTDSTGSTGRWIIVLYSSREKKTYNANGLKCGIEYVITPLLNFKTLYCLLLLDISAHCSFLSQTASPEL